MELGETVRTQLANEDFSLITILDQANHQLAQPDSDERWRALNHLHQKLYEASQDPVAKPTILEELAALTPDPDQPEINRAGFDWALQRLGWQYDDDLQLVKPNEEEMWNNPPLAQKYIEILEARHPHPLLLPLKETTKIPGYLWGQLRKSVAQLVDRSEAPTIKQSPGNEDFLDLVHCWQAILTMSPEELAASKYAQSPADLAAVRDVVTGNLSTDKARRSSEIILWTISSSVSIRHPERADAQTFQISQAALTASALAQGVGRVALGVLFTQRIIEKVAEPELATARTELQSRADSISAFITSLGLDPAILPDIAHADIIPIQKEFDKRQPGVVGNPSFAGAFVRADIVSLFTNGDNSTLSHVLRHSPEEVADTTIHETWHPWLKTHHIGKEVGFRHDLPTYSEVTVATLAEIDRAEAKVRDAYQEGQTHLRHILVSAAIRRGVSKPEADRSWKKHFLEKAAPGNIDIYQIMRDYHDRTDPPPSRTFDQEMVLYSDAVLKDRNCWKQRMEREGFTPDETETVEQEVKKYWVPNEVKIPGVSIDSLF